MVSRRVLIALAAAMVTSTALLATVSGERLPAQTGVDITAALAGGRTDDELVTAAAAAVADAQQAGDRRGEAAALETLAQVRTVRGEYLDAQSANERALTLWTDLGDVNGQSRALEQLADAQIRQRTDLDAAARTVVSLRTIRETQPPDPAALARILEFDATLQARRGEYAVARDTLNRLETLVGPVSLSDERRAAMAYLSGDVAYLAGDLERARHDWEVALEAARLAFPSNHPALITYFGRVATARHAMGDVSEARDIRVTALRMAEASLPQCHTDYFAALNDLAISDEFFGDYAGVRTALDQSLSLARQCLGPSHPRTAQALGNVGLIYAELGDLAGAERMQRDALAAWIAARGPTHPFVALAQEQLADVLAKSDRSAEALDMYGRALDLRIHALGESNPLVARVLVSRARLLTDQRKFTAATRDLDRAEAIYRHQPEVDQPDAAVRANMQVLRGTVEAKLDHPERARQAYVDALATQEQLFGDEHPYAAATRTLIAQIDVAIGDSARAFDEALTAENVSRSHLRKTIRFLPEAPALDYASRRPRALDVIVSIASRGDSNEARTALDALIRSRSLVLDELAARMQSARNIAAVTPDVMARFISARQRYASLIVQSLRETVPRSRLDAAREEADAAEVRVAEQSASLRADRVMATAGVEQVLAALPSQSALVAFVRYDAPRPPRGPGVPQYGAFVASDSQPPVFVPISAASVVEAAVRDWRAAVSMRTGAPPMQTAGAALRRLVWDPLVERTAGASRVFIVPDGALTIVNFAALPRRGGGYLVEDERVFHYLSAERDLLPGSAQASSRSALIVGGPSFAGSRSAAATVSTRAGFDCRSARPLAFPELPGAKREASEISSLWMRAASPDVVLLSGADATETAVKRSLSGHRVVHLATHGFFLGSACEPRPSSVRSVGGVVAANAPITTRNPLLLSGLAFAGANQRRQDATDDGILTAEEIASLDLRGTEWAVLSACDTGLGEIRSGEGVLGLRRAFQIAGARTVIMSLWSVDDRATREWMQSLYEARLTRGLDTAASVRAATLATLAQRRAAGLSTHPFYWAAFVAAGDWR